MKLSISDLEYLSQFDKHFACATKANYSPSIKRDDLIKMNKIYKYVSSTDEFFNPNCGGCILKMLKRLSVYYYEGIESRKAEQDKLGSEEHNQDVKKQAGRRKRKASQGVGEDSK